MLLAVPKSAYIHLSQRSSFRQDAPCLLAVKDGKTINVECVVTCVRCDLIIGTI